MTRQDGGYRLPYDMNPERFCIKLSIPKDMNHVIAFTGALYELTRWWNWERDSQHRATEAAAVWRDVLQQLVGQIDYSNPTEPTPCESETMPVQFRVSETCILEYSNDGETWTAVEGWSNFAAACFVGPEGPQGPQGPEGPEGEPGVIGAQVVRVDGDTPPDFYLTPETKILTAVMQEQWFRGIRSQPLSTPLEGHIPPHVIEIQTYDNPSAWLPLAYIPSQGTAFVPPPISDDPLTDEQKKCLAAMNATEVFMRTFADIGAHLTEQLFSDPLELMRALADSVIGLLTRDPARSFFDELATIISFLVLQAEYASTVFDADDREEFQQLLLDNASINPNGGVSFDREAVLIYMNARWTGQIPFVHQWGLMMDLVRFTGTEGLDRAGAVTFFTEPTCEPEPLGAMLTWDTGAEPRSTIYFGVVNSDFGNPVPAVNGRVKIGNDPFVSIIIDIRPETVPDTIGGIEFDFCQRFGALGLQMYCDYTVSKSGGGTVADTVDLGLNDHETWKRQRIEWEPVLATAVTLTLRGVSNSYPYNFVLDNVQVLA